MPNFDAMPKPISAEKPPQPEISAEQKQAKILLDQFDGYMESFKKAKAEYNQALSAQHKAGPPTPEQEQAKQMMENLKHWMIRTKVELMKLEKSKNVSKPMKQQISNALKEIDSVNPSITGEPTQKQLETAKKSADEFLRSRQEQIKSHAEYIKEKIRETTKADRLKLAQIKRDFYKQFGQTYAEASIEAQSGSWFKKSLENLTGKTALKNEAIREISKLEESLNEKYTQALEEAKKETGATDREIGTPQDIGISAETIRAIADAHTDILRTHQEALQLIKDLKAMLPEEIVDRGEATKAEKDKAALEESFSEGLRDKEMIDFATKWLGKDTASQIWEQANLMAGNATEEEAAKKFGCSRLEFVNAWAEYVAIRNNKNASDDETKSKLRAARAYTIRLGLPDDYNPIDNPTGASRPLEMRALGGNQARAEQASMAERASGIRTEQAQPEKRGEKREMFKEPFTIEWANTLLPTAAQEWQKISYRLATADRGTQEAMKSVIQDEINLLSAKLKNLSGVSEAYQNFDRINSVNQGNPPEATRYVMLKVFTEGGYIGTELNDMEAKNTVAHTIKAIDSRLNRLSQAAVEATPKQTEVEVTETPKVASIVEKLDDKTEAKIEENIKAIFNILFKFRSWNTKAHKQEFENIHKPQLQDAMRALEKSISSGDRKKAIETVNKFEEDLKSSYNLTVQQGSIRKILDEYKSRANSMPKKIMRPNMPEKTTLKKVEKKPTLKVAKKPSLRTSLQDKAA